MKYEKIITAFLDSEWGSMFTWENVAGNAFLTDNQQDQEIKIILETLRPRFSVCKVKDYSGVDLTKPFCFTGTTDEENSLVCPEALIPGNTIERDDGWKGFRIIGQLDFSLIGILARISKILAEGGIGIFAISIYFICLYGAAGLHGSCRDPEQIKTFDWSGYHFDEDRSSTDEYVFIRTEIPGKPSRR